jgi:phenylpropionate dioxygenase-like ring-hydroxylating dioxygenase large terminal subunit
MLHETQVALAKRMLHHIDNKSTDMLEREAFNNVSTFTSETQFAQEKRELFRKHPLIVGLTCQIPKPGDFLTDDFTGIPLLVTRTKQGEVRAYMNVCRHRGSKVEFEGTGCGRKVFTCPYHAWSFDLEGKLVGLPDAEGFSGIDRSQYGLRELPVVEKHGIIWARHTPGEPIDLDALLGSELSTELGAYDLANWHHYETRVLHEKMNWKGVIDTFLEIYHVGKLHKKTIAPIFHDNLMVTDTFQRNGRMAIARKTIAEVRDNPAACEDLLAHMAVVYQLFPNTVMVRQGEQVEFWRIYPGATTDESVMYITLITPEPAVTESAKRHWDRNMQLLMDTVDKEDFHVGRAMQASFHSGAQEQLVYGRNEPVLAYYHRNIREALGQPAEVQAKPAQAIAAR